MLDLKIYPFFKYLFVFKRSRMLSLVILCCLIIACIAVFSTGWYYKNQCEHKTLGYKSMDRLSNSADSLLRLVAQNMIYGVPSNQEMMAHILDYRKSLLNFQASFLVTDDLNHHMRLDEVIYLGSDLSDKLENIYSQPDIIDALIVKIGGTWDFYNQNTSLVSSDELIVYNQLLFFLIMTFNNHDYREIHQPVVKDFSNYINELNKKLHALPDSPQTQRMLKLLPDIMPILSRYWSRHQDLDDVVTHQFYNVAEQLEESLNRAAQNALSCMFISLYAGTLIFMLLIAYFALLFIQYQRFMGVDFDHAISTKVSSSLKRESEFSQDCLLNIQLNYLDLPFIQKTMDDDPEIIDLALSLFIDEHQHDIGLLQRYLVEDKYEMALQLLNDLHSVAKNVGAVELSHLVSEMKEPLKMRIALSEKQMDALKRCLKSTIGDAMAYQTHLRSQ